MRTTISACIALLLCAACAGPQRVETPAPEPGLDTIDDVTGKLERQDGLFTVYLDRPQAKVFAALPAPDAQGQIAELLYIAGLRSGIGSNPIGVDRGAQGDGILLRLRRVGARVLFEQPNLDFRAQSDNADERQAVAESFARSLLFAAEIVAEDPGGELLIELTPFLLRDARRIAARLKRDGEGHYRIDDARSLFEPAATLVFPDNIELEALLTFAGSEAGKELRSTVPSPEALTVIQHHSFVRLPAAGYAPRDHDVRGGSFAVHHFDFAQPLHAPLHRRRIVRHRLEKKTPGAAPSPVRAPIVYYVDRGAPEPVRSALVDGARWWAEAFEAAGFQDAYRVELLPEDAHPLDLRYNVIQWVHRATRGWSYGGGVVDPRTGERLKGHVWLGSQRVRQDILIFEGLLGAEKSGSGAPDDPVQLALARIRQLAAHEVGHALGLAHNFAASSYGQRESVMDYPAPLVRVDGDELDVSQAYGVGIGAWDRLAVRWAYAQFDAGADEAAELDGILKAAAKEGLLNLGEPDARAAGTASPAASLWDNGSDPVAALEQSFAVRAWALKRFGARTLAPGRPLTQLQALFVPVYLHHRYQLEATVKALGGAVYRHAVAGEADARVRPVAADRQRAALEVALRTLAPEFLDIADDTLAQLLPRPSGYGQRRELFASNTGPLFDALGVAASAADFTLSQLLHPARTARLVDQHRREATLPGLIDLLDALRGELFGPAPRSARHRRLREVVQRVYVNRLLALASGERTAPSVRALVEAELKALASRRPTGDAMAQAHQQSLRRDIESHAEGRGGSMPAAWQAPTLPPGSPIGAFACGSK